LCWRFELLTISVMASAELPKRGREPLTPAKRKRLETLFEHATKKAATAADYDYATELFSQCVLGEPGNFIYVRGYMENLQKKYNHNRKGHPLAQFKERGSRSALKKALGQEQWDEVIAHGLKVLAVNPWDVPTLTAMATAAGKMGDYDCEVFYLKCALMANPKDPDTNKRFAIALEERGMFDQAISAWHRVEEARPTDDEAKRAIAVLTVRKQRARGDFDEGEVARKLRVKNEQQGEASLEHKLRQKIEQEPAILGHYLELVQHYLSAERFAEAEELLAKAYEVSDGDADIREKWEDAQLRHLRQKISRAKDPAAKKKLQRQYFERDLEVCKNRVERFPGNLAFKYDLGDRYLRTHHYAEAIQELQVAKNDPRRKGVCMLALGQCFQQIKQYRLAMSHYESAIHEIPDRDGDNKKRALYLAGRLALALRNADLKYLDAAEKHMTTLAGLDFSYKDVSALLDKIARLRENPDSDENKGNEPDGPETDAEGNAPPSPPSDT
jgi:tetratricopeptide (TPR) repeat protein